MCRWFDSNFNDYLLNRSVGRSIGKTKCLENFRRLKMKTYAAILNSVVNENEKDYIVFNAEDISKAKKEAEEYTDEFIENTPKIWLLLEDSIKEECKDAGVTYGEFDLEEDAIRNIIYEEDGYYNLFELDSNKILILDIDELSSLFKCFSKEFLNAYAINN